MRRPIGIHSCKGEVQRALEGGAGQGIDLRPEKGQWRLLPLMPPLFALGSHPWITHIVHASFHFTYLRRGGPCRKAGGKRRLLCVVGPGWWASALALR